MDRFQTPRTRRHGFVTIAAALFLLTIIALLASDDPAALAQSETAPDTPSYTIAEYDRALNSGEYHSCGLRPDGWAICWGAKRPLEQHGQDADKPGPYTQVGAGATHTCALRVDGGVDCWGNNYRGQATGHSGPFVALAVGGDHNCGLCADGRAECWGWNDFHQADGHPGPFVQLSLAWDYSCGLRADGDVDCWGSNLTQTHHDWSTYTQISGGLNLTCGLQTDGNVSCWDDRGFELDWEWDGPYTQVASGKYHTCALKPDKTVYCWGNSDQGQLDTPSGSFVSISAGWDHTCGLRPNGNVVCWGRNENGQADPDPGPFGPFVGVNNPPQANNVSVTTAVNTPVNVTLMAADADGNPLTYAVTTLPQRGNLSGTPPNLVYTPANNYYGPDSFKYVANDGKVNSNVATVNITVSTPPPPTVLGVRRQYGYYFLHSHAFQNMVEVTVQWPAGNTPQNIVIRRADGSTWATIPGGDIHPAANGVSVNTESVEMSECPLGPCAISVIATGAAGSSAPRVEEFFTTVSIHKALSGNGRRTIKWEPQGSGWVDGQDYGLFTSSLFSGAPAIADAEPVVRNALDLAEEVHPFRIPDWVPIFGGDYGVDPATLRVNNDVSYNTRDGVMQSTVSGHMDVRMGNQVGTFPLTHSGQYSYRTRNTGMTECGMRADYKGQANRAGAQFALPGLFSMSVARPVTMHHWWSHNLCSEDDTKNYIQLGTAIHAGVQASGQVNAAIANAKVTIGGNLGVTRAHDFINEINTATADASVFANVNWRVLFWSKSWGKTWTCSIPYLEDNKDPICGEGRNAEKLIYWQQARRATGATAVLTANQPDAARAAGSATADRKLLSNVDDTAEPALAVNQGNGELMVVYTHDNGAPDITRAYDIAYIRRTAAGWSQPKPIVANQQADAVPDVAYVNGTPVAVWATLQGAPVADLATPEVGLPHMEIVAAVFNNATGQWSAPTRLTNNDFMDYEPIIANDFTSAMVVWYADPQNDFVIGPEASQEHDMSMRLYYATWDGTRWSAPAILVNDVNLVGKPSLDVADGAGLLAYTVDRDGKVATETDHDIMIVHWQGGRWLAPQRLTDDMSVEDSLPTVGYYDLEPFVAWQRVAREGAFASYTIKFQRIDTSSPTYPSSINAGGQVQELVFADSGREYPVLLWREFGRSTSAIRYAVIDGNFDNGIATGSLSDGATYDADYSPVIAGNGHLLSTYVRTAMTTTPTAAHDPQGETVVIDIPTTGQADVYLIDHTLLPDLAVTAADIEVSKTQPAPGSWLEIAATIRNRGDVADLSGKPIRVRISGGGATIKEVEVPVLPGGQSTTLELEWRVPVGATLPLTLAVEIDPDHLVTEGDESNNRAELLLSGPDLAVISLTATETPDRTYTWQAIIVNQGRSAPAAPATVTYYYNDQPTLEDAQYIVKAEMPATPPGESGVYNASWGGDLLPAGTYHLFAVVSAEGDAQPDNNMAQTIFIRSPGPQPDVMGVTLRPTPSRVNARPGTIATHTVSVTNTGNVLDRFDIVLLGSDWSIELPGSFGPLAPGVMQQFEAAVTVPANAVGTGETRLVVRSRADGRKTAAVTLLTTIPMRAYLPVVESWK